MKRRQIKKRKTKTFKKATIVILIALYISLILISRVHYVAEQKEIRGALSNGEYISHLTFPEDGEYGHYKKVILSEKDTPGKIDLKYVFDTNTLYIQKIENIEELVIDCRMMYENKAEEVFEKDPLSLEFDYYKTYFLETNDGLFTVVINSETPMDEIRFLNTPLPTSVLVNNQEWWETETSYYSVSGDDVTINQIPVGTTNVQIYFKEKEGENPVAQFTATKLIATPGEEIFFDASGSSDADGEILHYNWDFGDGSQSSGMILKHTFSSVGNFTVTLTVRDNDYLEDSISKSIFVVQEGIDTDNDGVADEFDPHPFYNVDTDSDGLSDDFEEEISKTEKTSKDSDDDGWNDNVEWDAGTDPNDPTIHPSEKEAEDEADSTLVMAVIILIIGIIVVLMVFLFLRDRKKHKKPKPPTEDEGELPSKVGPEEIAEELEEEEMVEPEVYEKYPKRAVRRPLEVEDKAKIERKVIRGPKLEPLGEERRVLRGPKLEPLGEERRIIRGPQLERLGDERRTIRGPKLEPLGDERRMIKGPRLEPLKGEDDKISGPKLERQEFKRPEIDWSELKRQRLKPSQPEKPGEKRPIIRGPKLEGLRDKPLHVRGPRKKSE